jgi:VWFA-related protein
MIRTTICVTLLVVALPYSPPEGGRYPLPYSPPEGGRYPGPAQERQEPPRFRVGVDAVRIDAVVVDRDGRIVRDLTADDFEIRQDGKLQKVTFAEFVPVLTGTTPTPAADAQADPPSNQAPPALVTRPAQVRRESVQRTFAIVVDDLGLSVESLISARKALHAFVDREIRPNDLVALVRTGGSLNGLQPYTTDRRVLDAAIDAIQWNGLSRNGVAAFESFNQWETFDDGHGGAVEPPNDFTTIDTLRSQMSAAGTLGALNLITQSARDLPGRKAIVLVSDGFVLPSPQGEAYHPRVREALDRAIDQAARTGVVIYALDARGLQSGRLTAEDNIKRGGESLVRSDHAERNASLIDSQDVLGYLAEQTGGFAVLNTNDLAGGLGRIVDDVRDYYVIGYVPDDQTFKRVGNRAKLHNVTVKVRRPGVHVKTRKAFIGVSDPDEAPTYLTPAHQLIHAAVSPFVASDIALRATTLPGYAPETGMFVRTLLHIDAGALTFADGEDGRKIAAADVLGMAFDQNGTEIAHLSTGFEVALTSAAADEALRQGLAYTLRIPIRRPGAYQVRFAVRDRKSGALGSTGEFVQVADIVGGAFALSGIVLHPHDGPTLDSAAAGQASVSPMQALRAYPPGTRLSYAYEIYNARGPVKSVATVWRGTDNVLTAPAVNLAPPAGNERRFAAAGGIKLGEQLPPGNYMLQIIATAPDPKREGRALTAAQRIAFDVR